MLAAVRQKIHLAHCPDFPGQLWQAMERAHWHVFQVLTKRPENMKRMLTGLPVLPNVWLGASVESSEYVERIHTLRKVPATIRFISFEPLLESVGHVDLRGIHWAIVGGESGPKARAMAIKWVDEIKRQCRRDDVKFFFKQWGGANKKTTGRVYRGQTWNEFPEPDYAVAAE